jgi:hypothetical protein
MLIDSHVVKHVKQRVHGRQQFFLSFEVVVRVTADDVQRPFVSFRETTARGSLPRQIGCGSRTPLITATCFGGTRKAEIANVHEFHCSLVRHFWSFLRCVVVTFFSLNNWLCIVKKKLKRPRFVSESFFLANCFEKKFFWATQKTSEKKLWPGK